MISYFLRGEKLLFGRRLVTFCEGLRLAVSGGQFAEDAAVAGGLYVVEPLAVVADTTVRTRLHAF